MKRLIILAIMASTGYAFAKDGDANIYFNGDVIRLKSGYNAFELNTSGQIGSVPKRFDSVIISVLPMNMDKTGATRSPVEFKVKKAGLVYIIVDIPHTKPFEKNGWSIIDGGTWGWNKNYNRKYKILQKHLEKGEHSLPQSGGFGTRIIDF